MNGVKRRGSTAHQRQKSSDVGTRRTAKPSTSKSAKEDRSVQKQIPITITLDVPENLKRILLENREYIKTKNSIVRYPDVLGLGNVEQKEKKEVRILPSVHKVLEDFQNWYLESGKSLKQNVDDKQLVPVIIKGILHYFDKTIATNLLYVEEQGQFAFVDNYYRTGTGTVKPGDEKEPNQLYGADHLLRLLVSLPEMLTQSSVDPYSAGLIGTLIQEMLLWLDENRDTVFADEKHYEDFPAHYKTEIKSGAKEVTIATAKSKDTSKH